MIPLHLSALIAYPTVRHSLKLNDNNKPYGRRWLRPLNPPSSGTASTSFASRNVATSTSNPMPSCPSFLFAFLCYPAQVCQSLLLHNYLHPAVNFVNLFMFKQTHFIGLFIISIRNLNFFCFQFLLHWLPLLGKELCRRYPAM